ncbi:hypothetical protein IO99_00765 [Clostridium sulfidigenes]|uniref:Uncharacterized protein n=1 Tax=Clostridium sulfidigenes TaxID=318464 RepID=A0A084JIF4_9CLOT|nr:hypothetical protein [Clostridium sulfidigenes]KEZ88738.1 hypothetical protein IO99_00765 [Clostridium sulfidigenes]HBA03897.1 hypothetical protein [Clostridium sp.]HCO74280.1 hypothetical protein [Clostridium sp.]
MELLKIESIYCKKQLSLYTEELDSKEKKDEELMQLIQRHDDEIKQLNEEIDLLKESLENKTNKILRLCQLLLL